MEARSQGATRTPDWVTGIIRMMIRSGVRLVDQFFLAPFIRTMLPSRDQLSYKGSPELNGVKE